MNIFKKKQRKQKIDVDHLMNDLKDHPEALSEIVMNAIEDYPEILSEYEVQLPESKVEVSLSEIIQNADEYYLQEQEDEIANEKDDEDADDVENDDEDEDEDTKNEDDDDDDVDNEDDDDEDEQMYKKNRKKNMKKKNRRNAIGKGVMPTRQKNKNRKTKNNLSDDELLKRIIAKEFRKAKLQNAKNAKTKSDPDMEFFKSLKAAGDKYQNGDNSYKNQKIETMHDQVERGNSRYGSEAK